MVQSASRTVHVRPAGEFRSGTNSFDGVTLPSWRYQAERPGQWLGQHLVLPERIEQVRRLLSFRNYSDHEGIWRGVARYYRQYDWLGHQSSRSWHRSEIGPSCGAKRVSLGYRRTLYGDSERNGAGQNSGAAGSDGFFTATRTAS